MKIVNKITLSLAVATSIFLGGCATKQDIEQNNKMFQVEISKMMKKIDSLNETVTKNRLSDGKTIERIDILNEKVVRLDKSTAKKQVTEESLGLRKTNLYAEESETAGAETKYGKGYAGSGYKIQRAFQDAPPMIPHDTEGMLPIKINDNQCVSCHMPEVASSMGATPIPVSHLTNFRPHNVVKDGMFKKEVDNMQNGMTIHKAGTKLVGARFNCSQCHAPQSTGGLAVENTFEAVYSDKDGASRSGWNGDRMTYGLNTTGKESYVTDKDLHMKSAAGHLEGGH